MRAPYPKRATRPWAERLWSKVRVSEYGCWEWTGGRNGKGYGHIGSGRRGEPVILAHKAAWILAHFIIPDGMHVLHHCDNPPCINPDHLFIGTPSADMVAKGRQRNGVVLGSAHPRARLNEANVVAIKRALASGRSQKAIASEYGVDKTTIGCIARGLTWAHLEVA